MVHRLDHQRLPDALVAFGNDLHHPSGDLVVASLVIASRMEASDLSGLLTRLAEATRGEARMRIRVEVGDPNQKIVSCVTADQVKADKASLFGGMSKDCKYDHFAMGGGKIDGVATCDNDGHQTKTTISGTFSSDSYQMAVRSESSGKGPMENMTMAMSVDAKRVGECRGTPDET